MADPIKSKTKRSPILAGHHAPAAADNVLAFWEKAWADVRGPLGPRCPAEVLVLRAIQIGQFPPTPHTRQVAT